jgi:hypothetical protein
MIPKVWHNVKLEDSWTPYREAQRYRRMLVLSLLLNLVLAAALLKCLR